MNLHLMSSLTFLNYDIFHGIIVSSHLTDTIIAFILPCFCFLSRLFGGEHVCPVIVSSTEFLSRLFGGERLTNRRDQDVKFLSRLFGGERK